MSAALVGIPDDLAARRRRGVRRTVIVLAIVVVAFYAGFIWLAAHR